MNQKNHANRITPSTPSPKLALLLLLTGCITVNVNFPESAVQKAADNYVREIYNAKQEKEGEKKKGGSSSLMDLAIPAAYALDVNVKTARALEIQGKLRSRINEILKYKKKGFLGETHDGKLTIPPSAKVKPILKKKVMKIVSAENKDRNALYVEVLRANGFASARKIDVQKSFARAFRDQSPSGSWIEPNAGAWEKKK